jgi:oxaloacetate decarboxylase alpha subunit
MPADQVDAMLAAGPARRRYNPSMRALHKLLRELAARPAARDLTIEKPGWRLTLRAGGGA